MIVYADTSALVKLVLEEEGSVEMRAMGQRTERLASVALAYPEFRAAVAAAVRDGRIPNARRDQTVLELERLWAQVFEIELDRPLLRAAGDLAEAHALRGYEAVHLAALVQIGGPDLITFACWDIDLRSAAQALGYTLVPS